jgi:hypothetical protein
MPTIRLDDDVFDGLKSLAEPFTDTPNTVIRRLLVERGILVDEAPKATRPTRSVAAPEAKATTAGPQKAASLVPQATYEKFLLHVLATRFNGRGDKGEVTKAVLREMTSRKMLSEADHVYVSSGETRAANTIAWGRNALKDRGLISQASPRGTWELTEEGMNEGRSITL